MSRATLIGMRATNVLQNLPADLSEEVFEKLIETDHVSIERIVSKGHTSPATGWYDQEQAEWVLLLQGAAELTFADGTRTRLNPGDHLNIPPHRKHKVSWTAPDEATVWLVVFYG